MPTKLNGSVGRSTITNWNGNNLPDDARKVQTLLNTASERTGVPREKLTVDGIVGKRTRGAIQDFQNFHFEWTDGLVHPGELTLQILDLIAAGGSVGPVAPPASQYNYQVAGIIPVLAQPNDMACWATVGTMLMSWRRQMSMTIETSVKSCGKRTVASTTMPTYFDLFDKKEGLPAEEHGPYARACGMSIEPSRPYSIDNWLHFLKAHGMLGVAVVSGPNSVHAVIVRGMGGDGTIDGTTMSIVDPWLGREYQQLFRIFEWHFEKMESRGWGRAQLWHY